MHLPVIIEPLPDQRGFTARLTTPFSLCAEAATPEQAHQELARLLEARLRQGAELRALKVPDETSGWLPDDDLTHDWLQHIQDYRAECDAADRAEQQGDDRL
jgi:hypothetical protein